jgi:hypothetical protein
MPAIEEEARRRRVASIFLRLQLEKCFLKNRLLSDAKLHVKYGTDTGRETAALILNKKGRHRRTESVRCN